MIHRGRFRILLLSLSFLAPVSSAIDGAGSLGPLSVAYAGERDAEEAIDAAKALVERDREAGIRSLKALAKRSGAAGDDHAAIRAWSVLSEWDPANRVGYQLDIARFLRQQGKAREARERFRRILSDRSDDIPAARIYRELGEIALYDLHRPGEAVEWFSRLADSPGGGEDIAGAELAILKAELLAGDLEGARRAAERALKIDIPDEARGEVDFFYAGIDLLEGRVEEARKILEEVSRRRGHPRSNDAIEILLWLEKDSREDHAISRGLARYRLLSGVEESGKLPGLLTPLLGPSEGTPLNGEVLYNLGLACRRAGRFDRAVEVFERIVSDSSGGGLAPVAELEAAEILWHELDRTEEAKRHLEQILLRNGDSVVAPPARRMLEELEEGTESTG